jgi:hypothetical protein
MCLFLLSELSGRFFDDFVTPFLWTRDQWQCRVGWRGGRRAYYDGHIPRHVPIHFARGLNLPYKVLALYIHLLLRHILFVFFNIL